MVAERINYQEQQAPTSSIFLLKAATLWEHIRRWAEGTEDPRVTHTIPEKKRWTAENAHRVPKEVKVLSFALPELKVSLEQATDLAAEIHANMYDRNVSQKIIEYRRAIQKVMRQIEKYFEETVGKDAVKIIFPESGSQWTRNFYTDRQVEVNENGTVLQNARNTSLGTAATEKNVIIPLNFMAGYESLDAAIAQLQKLSDQNKFPKIAKVIVYAPVGSQAAIQKLLTTAKAASFKVEVVVGDVAYQHTSWEKPERAVGEKRTIGKKYTGSEPYVVTVPEVWHDPFENCCYITDKDWEAVILPFLQTQNPHRSLEKNKYRFYLKNARNEAMPIGLIETTESCMLHVAHLKDIPGWEKLQKS